MSPPSKTHRATVKNQRSVHRHTLREFSQTVKQPAKLAQLLGRLCNDDSGSCLAFGTYIQPTKKFFDNFTKFKYTFPMMRRIGTPSSNGIVYEITYERHGLRAHTILKCIGTSSEADNLYYEYMVGHFFINECNKRFPCFLETYGAYNLTDILLSGDETTISVKELKTSVMRIPTFKTLKDLQDPIRDSCRYSDSFSIMIQHISSSDSIVTHLMKHNGDNKYSAGTLPHLLYQVYAPLSILKDTFTHYDLHGGNVLLYDIGSEKYIQMNYIFPNGSTVSFKTHLISKIIDYGRSYFYANADINSRTIYETVCKVCIDAYNPDNKCGYDNGYQWFREESPQEFDILTTKPNGSHDLRLIRDLRRSYVRSAFPSMIDYIFADIYYEDSYGTPYHTSVTSDASPSIIYNVVDAEVRLREVIIDTVFQTANELQYLHSTCVGTMNIYMDPDSKKSMTFIPK
jgi:hypothetical protein